MMAADAFKVTRQLGVVVCEEPPQIGLAMGGVLDVTCPPNVPGLFKIGDRVSVEYVGRAHYVTFSDPDTINLRLRKAE